MAQINGQPETARILPPHGGNPVDSFNAWAANPTPELPPGFTYIKEEPKMRAAQELTPSGTETKWITNQGGDKKYLFPNPRTFDQYTDTEMYAMDTVQLRAKGQNAARITAPCEMMAGSNFINYPGKLEIMPIQERTQEIRGIDPQIQAAQKMGYVQGVCECVAAIGGDYTLGKKLLTEMNVAKDMAKQFAKPETYKILEQGIFAQKQEHKIEQTHGIRR